jgi:hypothetical protein
VPVVADAFRRHPELAPFLALAIGHGVGAVRIGSVGDVILAVSGGVIVLVLGR